MRNAPRLLLALAFAATVPACQQQASDQNIVITNNAAGADIEALPPDESSATPTDELANGVDNVDASDANAAANSL